MRILVDADACPVKNIIEDVAKANNIKVIMYLDSSHQLVSDYSKIIFVDKSIDSADLRIIKDVKENDIVITQDYGLASLILNKNALCLNQNGLIYTNNNIEKLLFERFIGKENRRVKNRTKNMKKRNKQNDIDFEKALLLIIKK